MTGEHSKDSFVARIWLEPGNNGDTIWRGHLRHVQGNEEEYFQDLMEMREFLGRISGVTGPALTTQPLQDAKKLEPLAKQEPSAKREPDTATNMKLKHSPETQMPPIAQPTETEATKAQDDPKSLQPEDIGLQPVANWGAKVFYGVLITVLVFFWWLLIYSGGVVGGH